MYKVFVVDDEPIVLEGMRSKIDWESSGFTLAGESSDGEIALSMIQEIKPDILITDIKMPFMDGLTLSSSVKKIFPWIKIIILSGHDEFDYAKKAISIGIQDYILKPFTTQEILKGLNKAALEITNERKQLSDISTLRQELKSKEKLECRDFLNNLVHGSADFSKVMEISEKFNIHLISRYYKILIAKITSENTSEKSENQMQNILNSWISSWEEECTVSFLHHSNWIVCICKGSDTSVLEENVFRVAQSIEHIVKQQENWVLTVGIGCTTAHLSSLHESYDDAKKIIELSESSRENTIVSSDDIQLTGSGINEIKEKDPMVIRLRYAGKNDIEEIAEESVALVNSNPEQFSFFANYILADIIFAVSKLIENLGGNIKEVKPEIIQRSFIEEAVVNKDAFEKKLVEVLNFAIEYRDSKNSGKYGEVILKAKKYIEENYADPNTTLAKVADIVCLSPNHFSTIFSQQCKITFIEYLTNVRIENAKRLLKLSDKKGYDIAYECGFSDPHYFSYIFKKNTGLSPREYKGNN